MRRTIAVAMAAAVLTMMVSSGCFAAAVDVMMADFLLLRMRCPAGGYTVEERASEVEARANILLVLDGFDLSTIRVETVGADTVLYAGGRLLVTVDECTARANDTTPQRLADLWAERLRKIYPQVVPKKPLTQARPGAGG